MIERLIASGRDFDVNQKVSYGSEDYSTLEIARKEDKIEVVLVLERFIANPNQTRQELRVKLGLLDALAAEFFAVIVFLCDDLL